MCLISLKISFLQALLLCYSSRLTDRAIIITITVFPTQLFAILLTTTTVWLELFTQLVTRLLELLTERFTLLYLKLEGSYSRLLEKYTKTVSICAQSYMSLSNASCCWFRCSMLLMCVCVHIIVCLCCACRMDASIRHYNFSVAALIFCALILYMSGVTYSLKSTLNDRYLRNFS